MDNKKVLRSILPLMGLIFLAVIAALYVVDFKDYYRVLATLGVPIPNYPFIDWEYIGAGIKCWSEGINVYVTDPCDVAHRVQDLSPLWLRAVFIPTGRAWTMPIGIGLVVAYLASLFRVVRPTTWLELIVFALACTSTMALYGLERGNIDIIIFVMVVTAGVLSAGPLTNRLTAYGIILLAGLLKFYPLIALGTALRERPRTFFVIVGTVGLIVLGFCYRFRDELVATLKNIPHVGFGAANLPSDAPAYAARLFPGLQPWQSAASLQHAVLAILLVVTAAWAIRLVRDGGFASAFARMPEQDAIFLVIGAALIVGCFFAGRSIAYRGVHLIFVVVGLVAMRRSADDPATRATLTRATMIVIFLMWERVLRPAEPDEVMAPGLALWWSILFWFVRELLWWRLAGLLLAVLAIFTIKSEVFTSLRQHPLFGARKSIPVARR